MNLIAECRQLRKERDRRSKTKRKVLRPHMQQLRWMAEQPGRVFAGTDLISVPAQRLKYVSRSASFFPFSAGELAREYLESRVPERIMPNWRISRQQLECLAIPAPMHFEPPPKREGVWEFWDITACYHSLMRQKPLNMCWDFQRGGFQVGPTLHLPEVELDEIAAGPKEFRLALWGVLRSAEISFYEAGRGKTQRGPTDRCAPWLVGWVMDTMHKVAREAIETYDARLWLTDGGIFPPLAGAAWAHRLKEEYGLSAEIRHVGHGHLWAVNDYWVGPHRSGGLHRDLGGMSNVV